MAKRTPNKKPTKAKPTVHENDTVEQTEVKQVEKVNKKVVFDEEGYAPEVEQALNKEDFKPIEPETQEDSDDEAPEVVSLETGKKLAEESQQQAQLAVQKLKQAEKEKRRHRDQLLKDQQSIKKQKLQEKKEDEDEEEENDSLPAPLPSSLLEFAEDKKDSTSNKHIREFSDNQVKVNPERWNLIKNQEKHIDGFKVVSLEDDSNPYPKLKLDGRALTFLHKHLYKYKPRVPVILNMSRKEVGPAINFIRSESARSELGPRYIFN